MVGGEGEADRKRAYCGREAETINNQFINAKWCINTQLENRGE